MLFPWGVTKMLERLGRVTAAHPWRTVACWLVAAVALVGAGQAVGGTFVNDFRVPGVESQHAGDLVRDHFPSYGAASAEVVWHTPRGTPADPDKADALARMLAEIERQPDVTEVGEPVPSPDGRTAIATVRYGKEAGELTADAYRRLDAAAEPVRALGVAVDFRGLVIDVAFEPETTGIEAVGLGGSAGNSRPRRGVRRAPLFRPEREEGSPPGQRPAGRWGRPGTRSCSPVPQW